MWNKHKLHNIAHEWVSKHHTNNFHWWKLLEPTPCCRSNGHNGKDKLKLSTFPVLYFYILQIVSDKGNFSQYELVALMHFLFSLTKSQWKHSSTISRWTSHFPGRRIQTNNKFSVLLELLRLVFICLGFITPVSTSPSLSGITQIILQLCRLLPKGHKILFHCQETCVSHPQKGLFLALNFST